MRLAGWHTNRKSPNPKGRREQPTLKDIKHIMGKLQNIIKQKNPSLGARGFKDSPLGVGDPVF